MLLPAYYSFSVDRHEGLSLGARITENGRAVSTAENILVLRVFTEKDETLLLEVDAVATSPTEWLFLREDIGAIATQRALHEVEMTRLEDGCKTIVAEGHCSIF